MNITLIIGTGWYKRDIQLNQEIESMLKDLAFCHLLKHLEVNMVIK